MVGNVHKPTYFGGGNVLNSKSILEPWKQLCFSCKTHPNHDQNFIECNF